MLSFHFFLIFLVEVFSREEQALDVLALPLLLLNVIQQRVFCRSDGQQGITSHVGDLCSLLMTAHQCEVGVSVLATHHRNLHIGLNGLVCFNPLFHQGFACLVHFHCNHTVVLRRCCTHCECHRCKCCYQKCFNVHVFYIFIMCNNSFVLKSAAKVRTFHLPRNPFDEGYIYHKCGRKAFLT